MTTDEVREKIEAAEDEIHALCNHKKWTMHIPVDEERDSDVIIGDAFAAAKERIRQLERIKASVARAVNVWEQDEGEILDMHMADLRELVTCDDGEREGNG